MYKIYIFKKRVKNINRSSGRVECCIGQGFDSRSNKNQATSLLHKCKSLQRNRYFLTYGWSTSTCVFEAWIFFRVFFLQFRWLRFIERVIFFLVYITHRQIFYDKNAPFLSIGTPLIFLFVTYSRFWNLNHSVIFESF